jgi:hypothetical protein
VKQSMEFRRNSGSPPRSVVASPAIHRPQGVNGHVTVDDSEDQAVWAIRYRRRDNRSGLTVFLSGPIEIEVHREGPPTGPSDPK